jgi:hypothetical protein
MQRWLGMEELAIGEVAPCRYPAIRPALLRKYRLDACAQGVARAIPISSRRIKPLFAPKTINLLGKKRERPHLWL